MIEKSLEDEYKIEDVIQLNTNKNVNEYSIICSCRKTFESKKSDIMRKYVDNLIKDCSLLETINIPYFPERKIV